MSIALSLVVLYCESIVVALSCCAGLVWGDEEKVGAGEQQCSAGEHHSD